MLEAHMEGGRFTLSRVRNYLRQPHIIISLVLLLVLVFIVIIPFIKMITDSLIWHFSDTRLSRSARPGSFTLFHWKRIFASSLTRNLLLRPLFNSLSTSLGISVLAMLIGSLLAWVVVRTDVKPLEGVENIDKLNLWGANPDFVWENGQKVVEFWISNLR